MTLANWIHPLMRHGESPLLRGWSILLSDNFEGWFADAPYSPIFAEDFEIWMPPEEWPVIFTEGFENGGW